MITTIRTSTLIYTMYYLFGFIRLKRTFEISFAKKVDMRFP